MSLYTDLGADEAIGVALDRFYDKVYADPQIGGYFAEVDRKRLKLHASAFLAMAFGDPTTTRVRSSGCTRGLDRWGSTSPTPTCF
jgi:hemoglobin